MSSKSPRGIIELGNIKIKCIIFSIDESNNSEILSTSISILLITSADDIFKKLKIINNTIIILNISFILNLKLCNKYH